jgi:hypothetical protein
VNSLTSGAISTSSSVATPASSMVSPASTLALPATALAATYHVDDVNINKCTDIKLPPWPPPSNTVECTSERMGIRFSCLSSQGAELTIFCFAVCRDSKLHSTLDIMPISGYWEVLKIVKLNWSATQLKLTMFKCLSNLEFSLGSINWAIPQWGILVSPKTWVLMTCHIPTVHFQLPITVQMYTSSCVVRKCPSANIFLAILNGKAAVQQYCACLIVLTDVVCKGWIHLVILQGNTQYSELMSC